MENIDYKRARGVKLAWNRERELVKQGRGTRDWNLIQQKQILKQGRANHFEGHHIKSVKDYPEHASNPNNIQFLEKSAKNNEHLKAHQGNYKNETNMRYNPETGKYSKVEQLGTPKSKELSQKIIDRPGYKKYNESIQQRYNNQRQNQ